MQMLQQMDEVTILYADDYDVRHVHMNRTHAEHVTPSWYRDSVGHYEGDTLVIDTVGIRVGPFAMVDMYGTPHTEALHVGKLPNQARCLRSTQSVPVDHQQPVSSAARLRQHDLRPV